MRGQALAINHSHGREELPTSRAAPHGERAVLAILRAKAPHRALGLREAAQVADWQATALLELANLAEPPTPSALITELPRVQVRTDVDLPVSGCTSWQNGRWLIVLNGAEPLVRQRFSLAHEFKHAIDHRFRHELYVDRPGLSAVTQAELAADYFAACLLMPKRWLYRAWATGHQRVSELSRLFAVSPQAMTRRLEHLRLTTMPDNASDTGSQQLPTYARPKRPSVVRNVR
jgi:Zn-dependent peptidase ImmA (M78 family)